ncbi:MucBP domain-containing protein [Weissella cibaria]|uniref:MucBP domain-containing protein n=1 Tax=Weissella cibaria TaxID=137591 RepID=A0A2S1KNU4_9LACO|nr:MucBP domain-containing protein [Weissella cibaria]AWF94676.1 hypothetical protein B6254_0238 [Weissella cibaria]
MDTYKVSRRSATRRLLFSVALLGTVTLSAPISVVAATDGFSVTTPSSTYDVANGFLTFDSQTSKDQSWLVPSGNWYFSVNTADINAGLANPEVHAIYISAYGQRTQLTFNGDGTQTLTGDRGVSYRVQVKNGEVSLYNGGSNASMDIPVRTTQTTYFKDVNGKDIAPAVAQSNAIVGQDYTTTSKVIPGYTLTETPVNATGTVSNQKTTYVVGTTTTEPLYDDNGRQWAIATKTITDPAGSITETLQVTDRNGNPISGVLRPSEGGSIAPGSYGTFAGLSRYGAPYGTLYLTNHNIEPDTVTYVYKKNQETANIVLKTPDGTVLGKTTVTGDYGDTPSYTPPTIPGYTLTKTPTINPLNDDDTPTYEYEYTPKTETATVKAEVIDANGNPTGKYLQIDSSYKYPIEQSGPFNSSYKFGIPVLSGTDADEYMYAGSGQASDSEKDYYDPESGIVTGVYMDDTNTVTYYFREKPKPITPTVPVTPSTPDDGKNGNDGDKTNTGNGGDTTTPATPTTPETPDAPTKNPTITPDPNFVMGSATIEYVYADGSQAADPGAQSGRIGADYGFDAPDKPGYTKTMTGDALSGILGDQPKHIIVTYTPIEQTIKVHHVDEQGNKLADDTTMTGVTGDTATAEAYDTIKGYKVKGASEQSVTFAKDGDVTFVYTKNTKKVTVVPFTRDKNGNRVPIPGQTQVVEVPWEDNQTKVPVSDLPNIPYYTRGDVAVDGGYATVDGDYIKVDTSTNPPTLWVEYTPDTSNPVVGEDVGTNTDYPGKIVPVDPDGKTLKPDGDASYNDKPGTKVKTPTVPGYTAEVPNVEVPVGGGDIKVTYHKKPVSDVDTKSNTPIAQAVKDVHEATPTPTTAAPATTPADNTTTTSSDNTPVKSDDNATATKSDDKPALAQLLPETGQDLQVGVSIIGLVMLAFAAIYAFVIRPVRRRNK